MNKAATGICFFSPVVPLTTLLSFIRVALVQVPTGTQVFTTQTPSSSIFPYPPFRSPNSYHTLVFISLGDFLYATALLIVSSLSSSSRIITTILSATLQTTSNLLRQIAILSYLSRTTLLPKNLHNIQRGKATHFSVYGGLPLVGPAAEAVVGAKQGYENITLYKDVVLKHIISEHRYDGAKRGTI